MRRGRRADRDLMPRRISPGRSGMLSPSLGLTASLDQPGRRQADARGVLRAGPVNLNGTVPPARSLIILTGHFCPHRPVPPKRPLPGAFFFVTLT